MTKNAELRDAFARLRQSGMPGLWLVAGESLLGDDGEETVDGVHPTEVGFQRMANALEGPLRSCL